MTKETTLTQKLPEIIEFQDQQLQLLARSDNTAIYSKLFHANSIGNQIVWKIDECKEAVKLYRKLVAKHGVI